MAHKIQCCALFGYISLLCLIACDAETEEKKWPASVLAALHGHYPYKQCKLTNIMLIPDEEQQKGIFYSQNDLELSQCADTENIWQFGINAELDSSQCDVMFDIGHVILVFYMPGISNYFHLHWDTVIPLFKELYYGKDEQSDFAVAVLPSVERRRLGEINWKTDAFGDKYKDKYWNQVVRFVSGNHTYWPLDEQLLQRNKTICFKEVYFGTTNWRADDGNTIQQFIQHVMIHAGIPSISPTKDRIGIISRRNRRRILNEKELVVELEKIVPTDLIQFDGLTFKQQIELMQKYTVVAGMNGAGLINCIYLPPTSTCVQLVPYGAKKYLNFIEFGQLLSLRGPYTEWLNKHTELNVANQGPHTADTTVHIKEFVAVIMQALELSRIAREKNNTFDDVTRQSKLSDLKNVKVEL